MASVKYGKAVYDFVKEHVEGRTNKELAELTNASLGTSFTELSMKSYVGNHKLYRKNGRGYLHVEIYTDMFPKEVYQFIKKNHVGKSPVEMAAMLLEEFGREYTYNQIRNFYKNHGLKSGIDTKFKPGNVPPLTGKKGQYPKGCEKSWYRKGNVPMNAVPVGTERVRPCSGYVWIKIAEPNRWRMKHLVIWEEANGKVPSGMKLIFLDNDRTNVSLENLALVDNDILLEMNRSDLRTSVKEYTEVGVTVAKLKRTTFRRRKENDKKDV